MADWSPWYTTGTVAIANAGTTATGVGTNFHTAGLRPGDLITNSAMTAWAVVTAAPTTPTQLAITAWGGEALPAGSPYRILRISDADRLIGAHADLMAALVPNLTALGGITLAANKGIHATGAGALATHDLTPAGRAILALAGATGAKIPVVTAAGTAALRDIVGTVSQSGGVPTGAIVETGTNANGRYVRWADGTMICMGTVTPTSSIYASFSIIFAGSFLNAASVGYVSAVCETKITVEGDYNTLDIVPSPSPSWLTAGGATFRLRKGFGVGVSEMQFTARYFAIGRWY